MTRLGLLLFSKTILCFFILQNASFAEVAECVGKLNLLYRQKTSFEDQLLSKVGAKVGTELAVEKIPAGSLVIFVIKTKRGNEVGTVSWNELDGNGNLHLDFIEVKPRYQNKQIGQDFYEFMLAMNPEAQTISANLAKDNFKEFLKSYSKGKPCLDSLRDTPSYKISSRLGFSKIVFSNCQPESYTLDLVVGREN